jgi:uncharacterized protein DUF6929
MSSARRVEARRDPRLSARIIRRVEMRYVGGADATTDRPAHVRAASGLAWIGDRLAVIQDDANFIALVDPASGNAAAIALPAARDGIRQFDDARGNKADKLDFEGVVVAPSEDGPVLLALGSGSTARRVHVAVVTGLDDPTLAHVVTNLQSLDAFYAGLRAASAFAGSELNIEGAVMLGDVLRLYGRGNGAERDALLPLNATCDIEWVALRRHLDGRSSEPPPPPHGIVQYELGTLGGIRLGFTDAALVARHGAAQHSLTLYSAAAEASPDVTRDGEVAGSGIGVIEETSGTVEARWIELLDEAGRCDAVKVEGIAIDSRDPHRAFVAIDRDDHSRPSELCEVLLEGPWSGR